MNNKKILAVPTNIITGFLGVGKTSAILHLLKQKPANERWAILVNEFGEIGVDGHLIAGQTNHIHNIFIREVSGGCMCCASGLPMQIALNQLLKEAKPDRLLIEPTGLGHPIEVLEVLFNQFYKNTLSLEKTITLVDARNLTDKRYFEHEVFNQQIDIADIVVGSKQDLYGATEQQTLIDYINAKPKNPESIVFIENGELPLALLSGKTTYQVKPKHQKHNHTHKHSTLIKDEPIPESGFIKAVNQGAGFKSIGWRFSSDKIFNRSALHTFLTSIKATRLKAVCITSDGFFGYNTVDDALVEVKLDGASENCDESRIEIICEKIEDDWEKQLFSLGSI